MGGLFTIYRFGRTLSLDKDTLAFAHAEDLWNVERWFHLPSEATMQGIALHAQWFVEFANRYYVTAHFPVTIGVIVWLYIRHPMHYRRARALLIGASVPALFIQVGIPVAPPRMLAHHGILDTMALYGPTAYPASRTGISNQFAALPSLHVAWAVLLAAVAWRMRHPVASLILTVHAVMTMIVVLITGNHYWVDGMLGIALVAAVWLILDTRWAAELSSRWRKGASERGLSNAPTEVKREHAA